MDLEGSGWVIQGEGQIIKGAGRGTFKTYP